MARLFAGFDRSVEALVAVLMAAMVVIGSLQIFNRFFLNASLSWSEELQRYIHIWIVFLAVPIGYRRGVHIGMTMLLEHLPKPGRDLIGWAIELSWLLLAFAFGWYALVIMEVAQFQTSAGLGITMDWVYAAEVAGGVYLAFVALRRLAARAAGHTEVTP